MVNAQPNLRLLATFLAVVGRGSMSAAAHALGFVPSAVTQQIQALEGSIGAELLVRRPGSRIAVTPAGRSLAQAAAQLFQATADFQDLAHRIADGDIAELRIGAYGTAASHLLPKALATLRPREHGPALHLTERETLEGLPLVMSGELDVLVAHRYLPEDPPKVTDDLVLTPLGAEKMLLIAGTKGSHPPRFRDCAHRDWVAGTLQDADRRLLHRWTSSFGIDPRVPYETADCHTALEIIANDLAVGLLPATVVAAALTAKRPVAIVSLPKGVQEATRDILAVTRTRYWSPLVERLIEELQEVLASVEGHLGLNGPGPPRARASRS